MDKVQRLLTYLNVNYYYIPLDGLHHLRCEYIFRIYRSWFILQIVDSGKINLMDLVNSGVHLILHNADFYELDDMLCSFAGKEREVNDLPVHLELDANHHDLLSDMED